MKVGYPCLNLTLDCRSSRTFRLKNYTKEKLKETIAGNLNCLRQILEYNLAHKILFFRITSDLIPFGSHPVIDVNWQDVFRSEFELIGKFILTNDMRISMHPGQYTVLNSKSEEVYERSVKELLYHVDILDLLGLDATAKVQIHVGGVYNDKDKSLQRFIERYNELDNKIKKRLIIENDEKSYNLDDCLLIRNEINIPIVFDVYHDECYTARGTLKEKLKKVKTTWSSKDGMPIIHYSSANPLKMKGSHAEFIDLDHFATFITETQGFDFDVMLEIKDKEKSALKAIEIALGDPRFIVFQNKNQ